jgi:N-acetylmuramoyl-L-alanine amidase
MFRLAIDPGHGGPDRGAEELAVESEVNWRIANALNDAVNGAGWPIESRLIRPDSNFTKRFTNKARAKITNKWGADLVLSIHCNNYKDKTASGLMTFFWKGNEYARLICEVIQRCAPRAVYRHLRQPRPNPDPGFPNVPYVLAPHRAPVVLVELGFVSSQSDAQALNSSRIQREFVSCLMMGVARALTLHEKE